MNRSHILLLAFGIFFTFLYACNKGNTKESKQAENIPCIPSNLSVNVIAFYPFSNGNLNDVSGKNVNLTNTTTAKAAADRNGNSQCAFEFGNYPKDVDSLLAINSQQLYNLSTFSVSLWYQPLDTLVQTTTVLQGPKMEYIVKYGKWSVALYDCRKATFSLFQNNSQGYSVWDKNIMNYNTPNICQEEQKSRTGNWHHLVVTFDNINKLAKIYRDNVLQETGSSSAWSNNVPSINYLLIGSSFTGRIDDIAIFDKALTDMEISALYNTAPCCSNM